MCLLVTIALHAYAVKLMYMICMALFYVGSNSSGDSGAASGSIQGEYRRLFQPYPPRLRGPLFTHCLSGSAPKRRRTTAASIKLWGHNFVFLRYPRTALSPDARERAQLMAASLGEKKMEFQEGAGAGHVHKVLCKEHADLASTGYELCCVFSNRLLEVIPPPARGFTVDFLKTYLNHSKCYVRPIQSSLKPIESSVSWHGGVPVLMHEDLLLSSLWRRYRRATNACQCHTPLIEVTVQSAMLHKEGGGSV